MTGPCLSLFDRYLRLAFPSLAHLHDSLSQALGGSWEGDVVLSPGLRALEKASRRVRNEDFAVLFWKTSLCRF